MLQELDFSGKTAIIMGASQGIGLATAKALAAYGATVILAARSSETLEQEAQLIRSNGLNAFASKCDVSNYQSVVKTVEFAIDKTSKLDILVNNAAVIEPLASLLESDPDTWARAADINYKGVYHGMRAAIPHMLKQDGGTVINLSSGAANNPMLGWSHYCSNKAATQMLTRVAHQELEDKNIRVVGLSPGTVATNMMEKIRDAKINRVSHLDWDVHIPAEWVAEGIAFLCGEEGGEFAGTDFSLKTAEGRKRVGLPTLKPPTG